MEHNLLFQIFMYLRDKPRTLQFHCILLTPTQQHPFQISHSHTRYRASDQNNDEPDVQTVPRQQKNTFCGYETGRLRGVGRSAVNKGVSLIIVLWKYRFPFGGRAEKHFI
ncbi:hypothetical protein GWI33_007013 [Rhynchophorus ferrugineus]|uniref:Uncharacterized protein n=1 Tax=Rhynchophorus ferrugineus TaxID=354439 RepID=A0A834IGU7_RHYFE|nr:hypothetical protein GWI33_007013 [Rhynchophorus ferrugineus]